MEELMNEEEGNLREKRSESPRTRSEIRREVIGQMRSEGFRRITPQEVAIYSVVGKAGFQNLMDSVREYTLQESRILGVSTRSEKFEDMLKKWRIILASEARDYIVTYHNAMPNEDVHLPEYEPEEIAKRLKKIYS